MWPLLESEGPWRTLHLSSRPSHLGLMNPSHSQEAATQGHRLVLSLVDAMGTAAREGHPGGGCAGAP